MTTEKAVAARTKFGNATAYASRAVKDPEVKAMYQVVVRGGQLSWSWGDPIIVRATDDFKVAGVVVSVYNQAGDLVEQGNAVVRENEEMDWLYSARQQNLEYTGSKITDVATNLPGKVLR